MDGSERISLPDFLQRITVTGECGKHGPWSAEVVKAAAGVARCPMCASAERMEREERERVAKVEQSAKRRARALEAAGIGQRHMDKTFDTFVADTQDQRKALDLCRCLANGIAADGPKRKPSLILSGQVGVGKTHLCCALVIAMEDAGRHAIKIRFGDMIREIKRAWGSDADVDESDVLDHFGGVDLLVIDEVGVQVGSDTEKRLMFEVIDRRYEACLPTVLATNLDAAALRDEVGERVMDRLREDGGKFLVLTGESWRRRA